MSTFLELCTEFHRDLGMGGSLSAVSGQTGMLSRVVNWIADADYKIKTSRGDWNFMWAEGTRTLALGTATYDPPTLLGKFDVSSFWIDSGTDDAAPVSHVPYREYMHSHKHVNIDADSPDFLTVRPDQKYTIVPTPDSATDGKVLSFDYWKVPTRLANNSDVSAIPLQFHEIIIWRAKMYHAAWRRDNGSYAEAQTEFARMFLELVAHSSPSQENEQMGAAVNPPVIEVV